LRVPTFRRLTETTLWLLAVVAVSQGCSPKGASRQGVDDVRFGAMRDLWFPPEVYIGALVHGRQF
jgi:hypothetical protein